MDKKHKTSFIYKCKNCNLWEMLLHKQHKTLMMNCYWIIIHFGVVFSYNLIGGKANVALFRQISDSLELLCCNTDAKKVTLNV